MTHISIRELRRMGVSDEDIALAKITRAAQRRTGQRGQSLAVITGVAKPRQRHQGEKPVDFTERAMRKRGNYDQAALLADQGALRERSPERAAAARMASKTLKDLSSAEQLEFDFFGGGNVSIAFQYQDAVTEKLFKAAPTVTKAKEAGMILWTICRHLAWQSYECTKTAAQLCEITKTDKAEMARALKLLEDVGAIRRVKRGRVKVIAVTPEGAYRGNINEHAKAVERYKLDVIDGGKADE